MSMNEEHPQGDAARPTPAGYPTQVGQSTPAGRPAPSPVSPVPPAAQGVAPDPRYVQPQYPQPQYPRPPYPQQRPFAPAQQPVQAQPYPAQPQPQSQPYLQGRQYPYSVPPASPAPQAMPAAPAPRPMPAPYAYQPQPMWPAYYAQPMPVYAPVGPRVWWRSWRRKVVNRAMGLTLAYQAVMVGVSLIAGVLLGIVLVATHAGGSMGASADDISNRWAGVLSLVSVISAFGFMLLMRHRDILTREFWLGGRHVNTYGEPNQLGTVSQYGGRRMTPLWCLVFIVLAMGVQGVIILVQMAFSMAGVSLVSPSSDSINESAITVSMWLYIGLVGPICEEVVFRGVLMKELKPLGRNFAIFTSALAFGLFHDDVVQGVFAFLLGLVLGFIAMEYSLFWSIALHIFNNAILSGVVDGLAGRFLGDTGYMVYTVALSLIGVVGSIIVFACYGRGLSQYRRVNRSGPDTYFGWTSWAFIVFVVVNALFAIISFVGAMLV